MNVEVTCPRSCSIDSLRTTGHSRSVSHDSYFDLLQSPLRGMTTCPSRELSELGLNFDREEPEMRIFSESESLVSSPKVAKDTVPRRVLRARPEEYSSAANSVNPSPKKQPRLNLSSPSELKTWATIINEATNESAKDEESSSCKRYKLEDQLSDIQFIDCNTPEHSVTANVGGNVNTGYTIYTSIQIHNTPSMYERQDVHKTIIDTESVTLRHQENERYSYPVTQYTTFAAKKEERFSYPIAITSSHAEKMPKNEICHAAMTKSPTNKKASTLETTPQHIVQDVQRSCSEVFNKSDMNKSKLSVATPQTPVKSPCYSLLIGSTASSASVSPSASTTPIFDMDICSHYEPINFNAKDPNVLVMQTSEDKMNLKSIKKEMSLDLVKNRNVINVASSPNTPHNHTASDQTNETGNTSQSSITPSEIGYQNLFNRLSATPELTSPHVDDPLGFMVKPTIVHVTSPSRTPTCGKASPIKSTISITYNLKSPSSSKSDSDGQQQFFGDDFKKNDADSEQKDGLLETSFDETMVYEQVKFFRNAVEQVNDLVDENVESLTEEIQQVLDVGKDEADAEENYEIVFKNDDKLLADIYMHEHTHESEDEKPDYDQELEAQDSLEFDQNLSLYENVNMRRPAKIYENVTIMPSSLNSSPVRQPKVSFEKNYAIDDLDREIEAQQLGDKCSELNNVRKLATKFETSPVDVQPPFDFMRSPTHRKPEVQLRKNNNRNADLYTITRSLDENAFIREFGSAKKFEEFNKSINEIADLTSLSSNVSHRRKSIDYSKPKSLNPPKKLPGFSSHIPEKHENCRITVGDADGGGHKLKLNIGEGGKEYVENQRSPSTGSERMPLQSFNVRITPTTENRISLIQSNFDMKNDHSKTASDDEKSTSTTSLTSLKMLKLDRERIEKIKEERRHQLNEKYRSESFRNLNNNIKLSKPKSKEIETDDFSDDLSIGSQRFKSKSRSELDSEQPFSLISTTTSSSTNNLASTNVGRTRRISDEKNQNDIDSSSDDQVVLRNKVDANISELRDSKFENKTRPKFDKRSFEFNRERSSAGKSFRISQNSTQ